jgi:hypothetical protein
MSCIIYNALKIMEKKTITGNILDACIKIHNELGPGFLNRFMKNVLCYEL